MSKTKITHHEPPDTMEKTETEEQIDISNNFLNNLVTEGSEVVSNVRVANDAREVCRREEDSATRELLLKKVEDEAQSSRQKYEEINSKWSTICESKDPLDIHAAIKAQGSKCAQVLAQKDDIISQLKQQLEEADLKFAADQKKQNEDVVLLIDRIDHQLATTAKAYRGELSSIEKTLSRERHSLLQSIVEKWDLLCDQRRDDEIDQVEQRREIMGEYEQEMERIMIEHHEQYRAQKIFLETECQKLQQQVEEMKVLCLMNVDKLDYNYTILKRREEENVIVKNQQKRRIIKLQEILSDLKKNYAELEQATREKISRLQAQMSKSHKNIVELQTKSDHFRSVNERQYRQIWEMNTASADKLLQEIFAVDKMLYEQMLGLTWEPPEMESLVKEKLSVTEYWSRYREIFSPKKEQLWDAVTVGLGRYLEICKSRQKLMTETDSLRRQNSELRRLLETCCKVNKPEIIHQ